MTPRDREEAASLNMADAEALADQYPTLVAALRRASARMDTYVLKHKGALSDREHERLVAAFEDVYCLRAELGLET